MSAPTQPEVSPVKRYDAFTYVDGVQGLCHVGSSVASSDYDTLRAQLVEARERIDLIASQANRLNDEKNAAESQLADMKENYERACGTVAKMHAAAMGEVTGPKRGVVEDVADMKERADAWRQKYEALALQQPLSTTPSPESTTISEEPK